VAACGGPGCLDLALILLSLIWPTHSAWQDEQLVWRVGIALTSPTRGQIGVVGRLELEAITGEVLADETLAEELTPRAHALIAN